MCVCTSRRLAPQAVGSALFLSSSLLLLPLVYNLAVVYPCSGTWLQTSLPCHTGVHALLVFIVSVLLIAFLAVTALGACGGPLPPLRPWLWV